MGKLNHFRVHLKAPQDVYLSGQLIEGHVSVDLKEPVKIRGIWVHFLGGAEVQWTEEHRTSSGNNSSRETVRFYGSEVYFSDKLVLYGKAAGAKGDNPIHLAGQFTYPFQFQLPSGIPSSFEGIYGRVCYTINGVIDVPWKFDRKTNTALKVIHPLDLNREPSAMTSPRGQNDKMVCCLCCKSGPIEAECWLERGGCAPGDYFVINARITNASRRKMSGSFAELIQFSVNPAGPAFDLAIPLDVLIGSIPLSNKAQPYSIDSHAGGSYWKHGNSTAPPSYTEAVIGPLNVPDGS